jgi:hypothetical protein
MSENNYELQEYSTNTKAVPVNFSNINQGTVAVEASRAITEAQGKLLLAKQFPRSYTTCYANAIEACQRKSFAEKAFFSYPRGGQTVTGVTIRFAEEMARCYTNVDYGIKELSHEEGKSEMQAYCWDLETNTISSQNFTVEHIRESNGRSTKLTSQRDIYERTANDGARRLRSRILAILPPDLVEDCINECKRTLAGKNDIPLIDRVKNMVTGFAKLGVTKEMLETRLKHTIETVNADELTEYIGIFNGLKQKETTISDWFEQPKTASQLTELLEQEEKSKKKGADK